MDEGGSSPADPPPLPTEGDGEGIGNPFDNYQSVSHSEGNPFDGYAYSTSSTTTNQHASSETSINSNYYTSPHFGTGGGASPSYTTYNNYIYQNNNNNYSRDDTESVLGNGGSDTDTYESLNIEKEDGHHPNTFSEVELEVIGNPFNDEVEGNDNNGNEKESDREHAVAQKNGEGEGGEGTTDVKPLGIVGLISMVYFLVAGGAYGTEDLGGSIPALYALIGL